MKTFFLRLISLIGIVVIVPGCGSSTRQKEDSKPVSREPAAIPVEAYVVEPRALNTSITIAGSLYPQEETKITPEVAGKITGLFIREGSFVKKGTVLATLFNEDLKAQTRKLKVELELAQKTRERQDQLLKIGGISQQDFDLSVLNESSIKADIAVLEAAVNKTIIRAPYNGRLGFRHVSMGAYVNPQTVLTTISQVHRLKLLFSVPEKYFPLVRTGNVFTFTTETSPRTYRARIVATESGITVENRSLSVQAVVDEPDENLKPGSFANIHFRLGENQSAVMIPSQAVIPQARDKKVILYRNGKPEFATVATGLRDSASVEILQGVSLGDTVVTTGLLTVKPDSKLIISSFKK